MPKIEFAIATIILATILTGCSTMPVSSDTSENPAVNPSDLGMAPEVREPQSFPEIAAEARHSCLSTITGRLQSWGVNQSGQLDGVKCRDDCSSGQCGDSTLQWNWTPYTNQKYHFSVDYPPDWNVLDVPNPDYPSEIDQVWFSSSDFPPGQTDARPDIVLWITEEDPTPNWSAQYFDNYKVEAIQLSNATALRISGTNKESLQDELVVIVQTGDYFIQALPNHSAESLRYFDQLIYSLNFTRDLLTVPEIVP